MRKKAIADLDVNRSSQLVLGISFLGSYLAVKLFIWFIGKYRIVRKTQISAIFLSRLDFGADGWSSAGRVRRAKGPSGLRGWQALEAESVDGRRTGRPIPR